MSDCGRVTVRVDRHEAARAIVRVDCHEVTRVMVPGLQGREGSPGFDFTQATPSALWVINHNLGLRPSVQTFSVGGVAMVGTVHHLSDKILSISFNIAVAGFARIV